MASSCTVVRSAHEASAKTTTAIARGFRTRHPLEYFRLDRSSHFSTRRLKETHMTRREFLAAVAGASAMTLSGCAGTTAQKRESYRIIDAHAHWYPREFVELMEKEGPANG